VFDIPGGQLVLAQFGRPSHFSAGMAFEFGSQHALPGDAPGIAQLPPDKVKKLVDENAP
jgi:hypothetical protein